MPLYEGKENMGKNIKTEMSAGKPQKQAVAIAESVARKGAPKHVHDQKTHADGHDSGHKKIKRFMKAPYHNEDQE